MDYPHRVVALISEARIAFRVQPIQEDAPDQGWHLVSRQDPPAGPTYPSDSTFHLVASQEGWLGLRSDHAGGMYLQAARTNPRLRLASKHFGVREQWEARPPLPEWVWEDHGAALGSEVPLRLVNRHLPGAVLEAILVLMPTSTNRTAPAGGSAGKPQPTPLGQAPISQSRQPLSSSSGLLKSPINEGAAYGGNRGGPAAASHPGAAQGATRQLLGDFQRADGAENRPFVPRGDLFGALLAAAARPPMGLPVRPAVSSAAPGPTATQPTPGPFVAAAAIPAPPSAGPLPVGLSPPNRLYAQRPAEDTLPGVTPIGPYGLRAQAQAAPGSVSFGSAGPPDASDRTPNTGGSSISLRPPGSSVTPLSIGDEDIEEILARLTDLGQISTTSAFTPHAPSASPPTRATPPSPPKPPRATPSITVEPEPRAASSPTPSPLARHLAPDELPAILGGMEARLRASLHRVVTGPPGDAAVRQGHILGTISAAMLELMDTLQAREAATLRLVQQEVSGVKGHAQSVQQAWRARLEASHTALAGEVRLLLRSMVQRQLQAFLIRRKKHVMAQCLGIWMAVVQERRRVLEAAEDMRLWNRSRSAALCLAAWRHWTDLTMRRAKVAQALQVAILRRARAICSQAWAAWKNALALGRAQDVRVRRYIMHKQQRTVGAVLFAWWEWMSRRRSHRVRLASRIATVSSRLLRRAFRDWVSAALLGRSQRALQGLTALHQANAELRHRLSEAYTLIGESQSSAAVAQNLATTMAARGAALLEAQRERAADLVLMRQERLAIQRCFLAWHAQAVTVPEALEDAGEERALSLCFYLWRQSARAHGGMAPGAYPAVKSFKAGRSLRMARGYLAAWRARTAYKRFLRVQEDRLTMTVRARTAKRCLAAWLGYTRRCGRLQQLCSLLRARHTRSLLRASLRAWRLVVHGAVEREHGALRSAVQRLKQRVFRAWLLESLAVGSRARRPEEDVGLLRRTMAQWRQGVSAHIDLRGKWLSRLRNISSGRTVRLRRAVFRGWVSLAAKNRSLREREALVSTKSARAALRRLFDAWRSVTGRSSSLASALWGIASRHARSVLRYYFGRWEGMVRSMREAAVHERLERLEGRWALQQQALDVIARRTKGAAAKVPTAQLDAPPEALEEIHPFVASSLKRAPGATSRERRPSEAETQSEAASRVDRGRPHSVPRPKPSPAAAAKPSGRVMPWEGPSLPSASAAPQPIHRRTRPSDRSERSLPAAAPAPAVATGDQVEPMRPLMLAPSAAGLPATNGGVLSSINDSAVVAPAARLSPTESLVADSLGAFALDHRHAHVQGGPGLPSTHAGNRPAKEEVSAAPPVADRLAPGRPRVSGTRHHDDPLRRSEGLAKPNQRTDLERAKASKGAAGGARHVTAPGPSLPVRSSKSTSVAAPPQDPSRPRIPSVRPPHAVLSDADESPTDSSPEKAVPLVGMHVREGSSGRNLSAPFRFDVGAGRNWTESDSPRDDIRALLRRAGVRVPSREGAREASYRHDYRDHVQDEGSVRLDRAYRQVLKECCSLLDVEEESEK